MRPPRIVLVIAFLVSIYFLTLLSLPFSHSPADVAASTTTRKSGIQSLFSFRAPFSLFPPNAIITLTNDNTTAFLARPAAFGPLLPNEGLKGQLWIGSGFGDDSIRQGPVASGAEGELGCSDVPGWVENFAKSGAIEGVKSGDDKSATTASKSKTNKRAHEDDKTFIDRTSSSSAKGKGNVGGPSADDGTDDYLHHPLPGSTVSKHTDKQPTDLKANHADIQSIQEGAEIAGKVVLLSRGGCGFLEKVKWVQRRGGIALIVGDDKSGGPLIQMYARGDTSNVTIPAIFTSRTTAHLLSSLIGPGAYKEDALDEGGKATLKVQKNDKSKSVSKKKKTKESQPTFTATLATPKATKAARTNLKKSSKKASSKVEEKTTTIETRKPGWFKSLFYGTGGRGSIKDSSRPPSSGQLDWVLVDDWKDDDNAGTKKISTAKLTGQEKVDAAKKSQQTSKGSNKATSGDDFVIGVQDWRDPDLVGSSDSKDSEKNSETGTTKTGGKSDTNKAKNESPQPTTAGKKNSGSITEEENEVTPKLRGGSITPGSGEYAPKVASDVDKAKTKAKETGEKSSSIGSKTKGILTTIFGDDEEDFELIAPGSSSTGNVDMDDENEEDDNDGDDEEDGLWVTLTPTSGASPFLDTLLVLVVSPLVTLTVVYALLLLRSRIRRRRWRAPKSVVERLPVRTYQTINTPGSRSPTVPSPSNSSATTPLLSHTTPSRPRPRSRTTTGIPEPGDIARVNSNPLHLPALTTPQPNEHEKNVGSPSQWKKYMGKQIECVVCLEEYVDGVSQVMSLPCGHEFHVDCITPWLTTRRRTCPICKGDVVRSLARGSPSSPRYEAYHDDDSDDDIQAQAAETVNTSSSSTLPISRNLDDEIVRDLEQGISSPTPSRASRHVNRRGESWRSMLVDSSMNLLSGSLGSGSRSRSPRRGEEDRSR
ncbi:f2554108-c02c-440f-a157-470c6a8b74b9 [Sclerotinia trifoliorum]|uniref:RING-type E3 ubiquitin transferase n=1 Tax=Sclerotinia trifoliorum TaxID=28548 RepID=A0A8H2W1D3_9HELO|nr:f2554108-c02c-440f-a157-470c6a8b74b9 [Sclerotinia trifoliorum]